MTPATISVIIDNFNYADFVGAAIDSAIAQGDDIEVIVVDDGSTDGSRSVIERYGSRITGIFQENAGQGAAFNTGFAACTGDVIMFLDADDLLAPVAAAEMRGAFEDPRVGKLHWSLAEIDRGGSPTGNLRPEAVMPRGDLRPRVVEHGPLGHSNPPTSGNAFARRVLEQMMPMPEADYRICADAYLVMLASIYGELSRSLVPLSYWRRHGENRFNGTLETIAERVDADLERYDALAATLAVHLEAQGTWVDPALWQKRNIGYRRLDRIRATIAAIERVVPENGTLILVDDGDWEQGHLGGRDVLRNRSTVRLFEGTGLPEPPAEAALLAELKRLERLGATHIVFVWPGSWWLQHYPGFEGYLRSRGTALGGPLLGYDLTQPGPEAGEEPLARLPRDADLSARRAQLALLDSRIGELRTSVTGLEEAIETRSGALESARIRPRGRV
jgi:hypothetical protein